MKNTSILTKMIFLFCLSLTNLSYSPIWAQPIITFPSNECKSGIYHKTLEIQPRQSHFLCENTCTLTVGNLIMHEFSRIMIHPSCASFALQADNATFGGQNTIEAGNPIRKTGMHIDIAINEALLKYPPVQRVVWRGASPIGNTGVTIMSFGGQGSNGIKGSKGANARRKHCGTGSSSGDEAGKGGPGRRGGRGGDGGDISGAIFVDPVASGRAQITRFDILAVSIGGSGGLGGTGGDGGDGVSGHTCALGIGKRSGFPSGPLGDRGPRGEDGEAGSIELSIKIGHFSQTASDTDRTIPLVPSVPETSNGN